MATVSIRVPEEMKERMRAKDVNWSAMLRKHIEAELATLESRNVAHAVATSERLSRAIDQEDVAAEDVTGVIRDFRDARSGTESS